MLPVNLVHGLYYSLHFSDKSVGGSWLYSSRSTKCHSENNFHILEIIIILVV
jgi:hypothetical protein